MNVGENMRRLRKKLGYTQADVAREVNVTPSMINQIERGSKVLTVPLGLEIAKFFQCTFDELLEGEKFPYPKI